MECAAIAPRLRRLIDHLPTFEEVTMIIDVETRGAVRVLRWRDGENRCNAASMNRWHEVLAELETIDGPLALVIVGEGKYFSNGLDLDRFTAHPEEAGPTVEGLHRLFGRLLLFPAYTVAASAATRSPAACCAPAIYGSRAPTVMVRGRSRLATTDRMKAPPLHVAPRRTQ
jgi:hypothetical protein